MEVATGAGATVGSLVEAARGRWERWRRGAAISAGLVVAASARGTVVGAGRSRADMRLE